MAKVKSINLQKKIGVLGGGQLGRMLQEVALRYGVDIDFLDPDIKAPCSIFSDNFTHGSYQDFNNVIQFGKDRESITIEIEHVNTEALTQLAKYKIEVIPSINSINLIKNKALQKQFYADNEIPTSPFIVFESKTLKLDQVKDWFPFVQKTQLDGYDGKGVVVIQNESQLKSQLSQPSIIEKLVDIDKELAITIAIEKSGKVHLYPICEMVFNAELNLVDYLIAPAHIDTKIENDVISIAQKLAKSLKSPGIFTIELFLTKSGEVLVNEIAPRAHNSAHYSIEACNISQYEAQLRILLDIPIDYIKMNGYAGMVNLIGEKDHNGMPQIENLDKLSLFSNSYLHMYGKKETKPGRKMGHITIISQNKEKLIDELIKIKDLIKITSK